MKKRSFSSVWLVATLLACGGSAPAVDAAAPVDATQPTDAAVPTVTLTGQITDFATSAPIADVEVCIDGGSVCATTDAAGEYTLPYPMNTESYILASGTGYMDNVATLYAGADFSSRLLMLSDEVVAAFGIQTGMPFDPTQAHAAAAIFEMSGGGAVGATVTDDAATGLGPIYLSATGIPDPTLTAVTASGRVGWENVAPGGVIEITIVPPPGETCVRSAFDWPGSTPLSQRVPLIANALSSGSQFICN